MFDVSFGEMLVIAIVALVVIGPEKLPKVARTLGALMGRVQRYVGSVKADVERELQAQDLNRIHGDVQQAVDTFKSEVTKEAGQIEAPLAEAVRSVEEPVRQEPPAGNA